MTLIAPAPLPKTTKAWLEPTIKTSLSLAINDTTYAQGCNILRWFVKGWIAHIDPEVQNDLSLFAFAKNFDGTINPQNSAKGYAILRAAFIGQLTMAIDPNSQSHSDSTTLEMA